MRNNAIPEKKMPCDFGVTKAEYTYGKSIGKTAHFDIGIGF